MTQDVVSNPVGRYDPDEKVTAEDIELWRWEAASLIDHRGRALATMDQNNRVKVHVPARVWTEVFGNHNHITDYVSRSTIPTANFIQSEIARAALQVTSSPEDIFTLHDTVAEFGEDRLDGLSLLYMLQRVMQVSPQGDLPFPNLSDRGRLEIAAILAANAWADSSAFNRLHQVIENSVSRSTDNPAIRAIMASAE